MPNTYVQTGAGTYTEIAGTKGIFAQTGAAAYTRVWQAYVKTGASTWVKVYQFDTANPVINANRTTTGLANANMRFAWSGGALVTDADSGVASVKIQVQYTPWGGSGEGWTDWQTLTLAQWQATSGSFDFTPSTAKRRQWSGTTETVSRYYVGFRVVAVDNVGLTTNSSEVANLTKPYGSVTVLPNSTGASGADSYAVSPAGWAGLTNGGVRFGDGTSVGLGNWTNGAYFYNTQLQDACSGYAPDSGTFVVQRKGSLGISGNAYFKYHGNTFSTGTTNATFGGDFVVFDLTGPNVSGTLSMPANWLSAIPSGTARGFGMLNGGASTVIKVLYSHGELFSTTGTITLTFT
jgi:hypothetical protein